MNSSLLILLFLCGLALAQNDTHCENTINGITMTLSKTRVFPTETCLRLGAALRQVIENQVSEHIQVLVASRRQFAVPDEARNVSCGITLSEKNFSLPNMTSTEECRIYQGYMNILAEEIAYDHLMAQRRYHDLEDTEPDVGPVCPNEPVLCYLGMTGLKKDDWTPADCKTARGIFTKCVKKGVLSDMACLNRALMSMDPD